MYGSVIEKVPVSGGDALIFSLRNVHNQSISTDVMARNSMPAPIPIIRFQFECFPLFEALVNVRAGDGFGGVSNGDVAT